MIKLPKRRANLLNVMENKVAKKDTPSIQKLKNSHPGGVD